MKAHGLVLILARVKNESTGQLEALDNHGHSNLDVLQKFTLDVNGSLLFDGKQIGLTMANLVLGNKWVDKDSLAPARVIRSGNVVALEGLIRNGTTTSTTVITTLPVGYRPARKLVVPVWTSGNVVGYLTINTNGQVQSTLVKAAGTSLDGVMFVAQ